MVKPPTARSVRATAEAGVSDGWAHRSVAPFSELANRYGDDLAIVWIDSHPDVGTPDSEYPGYHAMAVTALTGHGDPDVRGLLPATVSPDRVALVGLHSWPKTITPTSPNGVFVRSVPMSCG